MPTTPLPAQTPYLLDHPALDGEVPLYAGKLELRHSSAVINGPGEITLKLRPNLGFGFVMHGVEVFNDVLGEATLAIPARGATMRAFVGRVNVGSAAGIRGSVSGSAGRSDLQTITEVRFLVANLPEFLGERLQETAVAHDGTPHDFHWRGRLQLAFDGWTCDLDSRHDHKAILETLRERGGFEITHVGRLRREDQAVFHGEDAEEFLDYLAGFLGFVCGAWATPIAAVGYDAEETEVWWEYKDRLSAPWRPHINAFDRLRSSLGEAFAGYATVRREPLWSESLPIATHMYVEANGPVTADTALVIGQAALELISWVRFVEELKSHSAHDFDAHRAADRLRELLDWLNVDTAIPSQLTALTNEAARLGWADGPHAISALRNALVHPRQRQRLTATAVGVKVELQELVLWYLELALLRLIRFDGEYSNRLGTKFTGATEPLPWSDPL